MNALSACLMVLALTLGASAPCEAQSAEVKAHLDAVCGRPDAYGCYANHKYGYMIAWPKLLLSPQGESDSGDGQAFASRDGRAAMACWACFSDVTGQTLKEAFGEAAGDGQARVTYKHLSRDFFVVSGFKEGRIFYRKTLEAHGVRASFELSYDPALKQAFDPVVKDLARSLSIDPAFAWQSGK
ncbi:MAG: hypothetical protein ACOZEN_09105 [Thermodesulfobacteriota bacterium]